ncbi:AmmeMemoRadiSam system radical SAM enzyme [Polyangium sp. 15x6]|uniref:AmmeMemoRadiSam system radical SAM enzyme n=1 Tax=Polyangium sp. 15x6 TaxID=3042687 RepID=UPI00249C0F0B|nr:AmmeMemoRadiSam system radical SAM enzyme [Polyangium sp. 15x6]MDI3285129.1 AmmeMemoRadiSam system radical SAM enzyme [Polyangium sp. 15x6]
MTSSPEWRPARFYRTDGVRLTCTLCPFACALADGDRGRCHVRQRRGDTMETATYATSVLHAQPIERKPLYHVHPGKTVLTVAAPGCTFACTYCQNFSVSQYGRTNEASWSARPVTARELVAACAEKDALLAFSYTEPILAAELTLDVADLRGDPRPSILWKTNGFVTTTAARLVAPALLAANVDLKTPADASHRKLTAAPLAPVLEALSIWKECGVWLEISTPLIPGLNTDDASLRALAALVFSFGAETPWHLVRFHPDYRLQDAPPTHPDLLRRAVRIARDVGLAHVYVERALGEEGHNTHCAGCGQAVIRRDVWVLAENALVHGKCPHCSQAIPGRWDEVPA